MTEHIIQDVEGFSGEVKGKIGEKFLTIDTA